MRSFAIVAVGGAVGTLSRHGINEWLSTDHLFPAATFAVNVSGAFLLGLLLMSLTLRGGRTGSDTGTPRDLRLLLGTGFLGGFTTYSTLAVETETLLRHDHVAMALTYGLGSTVLGLIAALGGAVTARAVSR
ncbi:fluoride efflux transporter FluC [Aeromicrobium sp. UC242_57]|uniref:fluoride efflux transporter FluC n=1 Tax=Aeromicrobium sp. UC242_57 TaxID=3374624 RepID=UPI0037984A38